MDAVDAALVDISNEQIILIAYRQFPFTPELCGELKSVSGLSNIDHVTRLDIRLGRLFAEAVAALIQENGLDNSDVAAIGSHGQTLLHRPEPPEPTSLQIGDPTLIAHLTGITTVSDFRRMDMAAGGQGAPLTPALHNRLFRHATRKRVIVNIGGMANITILPPLNSDEPVCGFDTGPGNVLLDDWVNKHTGHPMDLDGKWAAGGTCDLKLLGHLLRDGYFDLAPPKSTGRDYFNLNWLQSRLDEFDHEVQPADVQSTLVLLTASTITQAIDKYAPDTVEVIVGGGGAHNPHLMQSLAGNLAKCKVMSTADLGINPDALEAIAFAWLARRRIEEQQGNLPSVTGASAPVLLGCIYKPGTGN